MQIYDRYVMRLFIKVLVICVVSITGLYIVIDTCNNLDELLSYGRQQDGFLKVLADYYGARVPWFFDQVSGLFALVAAIFAITWLRRTNEMTALMAMGVSQARIIRPLIIGAVATSLLAAANREVVIPAVRQRLLRDAQDWLGKSLQKLEPVTDYSTDILMDGHGTYAAGRRIESPSFRLPKQMGSFGRQLLLAKVARYEPPIPGRPGGYRMIDVQQPTDLAQLPSIYSNDRPILLSPYDTPWLAPTECFVASRISFEQLAGGRQWRQLASTPELLAGLRNPSFDYGLSARVAVHVRFVQPLLDVTLLFLGLPLACAGENRNIFVAAGSCLLVVLGFYLIVMLCQVMGSTGYLLGPALAAWAPLLILVPVAAAASSSIWGEVPVGSGSESPSRESSAGANR